MPTQPLEVVKIDSLTGSASRSTRDSRITQGSTSKAGATTRDSSIKTRCEPMIERGPMHLFGASALSSG